MKNIRIKCPAKINLTLEILNKREDGFHNINSIMQLISLYDYLDITVEENIENRILLSGNSDEIPYNEKNLVYKAVELFLTKSNKSGYKVCIQIEKNIPIAAGLAGGSTDAAGTLYGLNKLFGEIFSNEELHSLCALLGSDLNVCLEGGCLLATSRGEKTDKITTISSPVTLIKPKKLGISAKEAYTKYSQKEYKPKLNRTKEMINAINLNDNIERFLYNDLEYAIFDDYPELQYIKRVLPKSIMSGSGSTYFVLDKGDDITFPQEYTVIKGLEFISHGVIEA